jgi:chemotaxis protein MotB
VALADLQQERARSGELTAARQALADDLQALNGQREQLQATIAAREDEIAHGRAALEEAQAQRDQQAAATAQANVAELQRALAAMEQERDALAARPAALPELGPALAAAEGERDGLRAQLAAVQSRLDAATTLGQSQADEVARLSGQLVASEATLKEGAEAIATRDTQLGQLRADLAKAEEGRADLADRAAALQLELERTSSLVSERQTRLDALQGELRNRDAENTRLTAELAAVGKEREELGAQIRQAQQQGGEAASRLAALEARAGATEQTLAQRQSELEQLRAELDLGRKERDALVTELDARRAELQALQATLQDLAAQRAGLQGEVMRIMTVLRATDDRAERRESEVAAERASFGGAIEQLNQLARFRSEFFARLSSLLGDRHGFEVVGDRFVFPAEVLFASGSAQLEPEGRRQLDQVAGTLKQIAPELPPDLDWILRVDGHTDGVPIRTDAFTSNWDLAAARALAVVEYLIAQGVPPEVLSANALGEFHPLVEDDSPDARRRNRRIEFKLTER